MPLQRATVLLGDALRVARADRRTFDALLHVAITRPSAEAARRLDRERRL